MIGICIFDLETLQFIDINEANVQMYGYSREELLNGMGIYDLSAEHKGTKKTIQYTKSEGATFVPLRYHRKKDGTIFPVEIACEPFLLDSRQVALGIVKDITDREQAKEALLDAQSELEQRVLERTEDLEKTNATLAMMLDYARKTEAEIQERVVSNLRSNLMGIIDRVKKQQLEKSTQELVALLESTTQDLAHPLARNLESQLLKLTAREIQLANFIRLGKSTKELMELFNLSANTVGTHRNNLRKKLGLSNKKINLRTYLNTKFVE